MFKTLLKQIGDDKRDAVLTPLMLASAMVMTSMIHPRFALLFLIVIICLAAVLALISSKANPTLRKVFHVLLYPVDFMDGCKNAHCRESDGRAAYDNIKLPFTDILKTKTAKRKFPPLCVRLRIWYHQGETYDKQVSYLMSFLSTDISESSISG